MKTTQLCPKCRQPLPENAPEGLCPVCLAKAALESEPAPPEATIHLNPSDAANAGTRVPPTPAQLAIHFPQLEILELLGQGGMGMVYKARQPRLDRFVALKILPVNSAAHPSLAERFNREARALAKLNHQGIVDVYDFGQTGQYYYFIMEYVDGMNLRRLLQSHSVEPRQALELVMQICTALQYAHEEGVVHRDIKPENILINKKGRVKIADFGLAKLLGVAPDTALTMSKEAMGTLSYMAPEQREDAQKVDHRADIYSLGVVFYEMLTGEVPMGRFEPPSKKVQVDVRLDEVVLRALEREPARRYQQASEVRSNVEVISSTPPEQHSAQVAADITNPQPVMAVAPRVRPPLYYSDLIAVVIFLLALYASYLVVQLVPLLGVMLFCGIILIATFRLSSRLKIERLREKGLWPQVGGRATDQQVKRLSPIRRYLLRAGVGTLVLLLLLSLGVLLCVRENAMGSAAIVAVVSLIVLTSFLQELHRRTQIQQARECGLWPQLGEIPSVEHVQRLARAGEKVLAVKLYRQICRVPLKDAKEIVEGLAG